MTPQSPPEGDHPPDATPQTSVSPICLTLSTHTQCHTACGTWRCCQCRAESLYNALWCVCDHLICKECALVYEACRIFRQPSEKREPVREPPLEEKEGWASDDRETSEDEEGKEGEEEEEEKKGEKEKPTSTCWMFWECCVCGANNAPSGWKCGQCARAKCDFCYRRLPERAALVGDFM